MAHVLALWRGHNILPCAHLFCGPHDGVFHFAGPGGMGGGGGDDLDPGDDGSGDDDF
jgi:hypothetical protein